MAQRSHVPQFGNWDNEVPFTVYFEKARKGKTGGKMMNPNDPQENPEMFSKFAPPSPSPAPAARPRSRNEPEEPAGRRVVRPTHERKPSKEDGDLKQSNEYLAPNDNLVRRTSGGSTNQRGSGHGSGSGSGRQGRTSGGSENNSMERSPMHPQYQAKLAGRGNASPAWEGGKSSYDVSHGTPGRSRMKPTESPDRGVAVPRFGNWDENNPSSADNYTNIFNKLREEKATGSPMVGNEARTPNRAVRKETTKDNKGCSCFPWFSK